MSGINRRIITLLGVFIGLVCACGAFATDPWIISTPVTITQPTAVGDVVVVSGGSLEVRNVPAPGFQLSGNLWVTGTGSAVFDDSVIRIMSRYNGQYALAATDNGTITVSGCDYKVPSGVQHAILSTDNAHVDISDTDFDFVQLMAAGASAITASRLNGQFECIVQEDGNLELTDIPRDSGAGLLWVWPTFMPGSSAVYSPPLPGFIDDYQFPPASSEGINQTFKITRCEVKLWPMLVREGCDLTLKDISPDNWVVVGFHLPADATVDGLYNNQTYDDWTMPFSDRTVRIVNSTIDTWNLYPEKNAAVTVKNSLIGELLAMESSVVTMEDTTVDGSGGFFGSNSKAKMTATGCTFTCTVQATDNSRMTLLDSLVLPYPEDPQGLWTRFGAYDEAILHLGQTPAISVPDLGGSGAIILTYLANAPSAPPPKANPVQLTGFAALYCLDGSRALKKWSLKAKRPNRRGGKIIGEGTSNVESGVLGSWGVKNTSKKRLLILKVKDSEGGIYKSTVPVPGD